MNQSMAQKKRIDSSVGLMFPASILVGFVIGYFLDKYFGTEPILLIIFVLYGIIAAFVNLLKYAKTGDKKK